MVIIHILMSISGGKRRASQPFIIAGIAPLTAWVTPLRIHPPTAPTRSSHLLARSLDCPSAQSRPSAGRVRRHARLTPPLSSTTGSRHVFLETLRIRPRRPFSLPSSTPGQSSQGRRHTDRLSSASSAQCASDIFLGCRTMLLWSFTAIRRRSRLQSCWFECRGCPAAAAEWYGGQTP